MTVFSIFENDVEFLSVVIYVADTASRPIPLEIVGKRCTTWA